MCAWLKTSAKQERFDTLQLHGGGSLFHSLVAVVSACSMVESALVVEAVSRAQECWQHGDSSHPCRECSGRWLAVAVVIRASFWEAWWWRGTHHRSRRGNACFARGALRRVIECLASRVKTRPQSTSSGALRAAASLSKLQVQASSCNSNAPRLCKFVAYC